MESLAIGACSTDEPTCNDAIGPDDGLAPEKQTTTADGGRPRFYDAFCSACFVLGAAALLLLTARACYWSGPLLALSVPLVLVNVAVLLEFVAACVSRDAAEELALAVGVTAYKVSAVVASLVRTAALGPQPLPCAFADADGRRGFGSAAAAAGAGGGGCRACAPDLRWAGIYVPALLCIYRDNFWPLLVAMAIALASRSIAEALLEVAAERSCATSGGSLRDDRAYGGGDAYDHDDAIDDDGRCKRSTAAAAAAAAAALTANVAAGMAAVVAYAVLGGRQVTPLLLLAAPVLVGTATAVRCRGQCDAPTATSAAGTLARPQRVSLVAVLGLVVELAACVALTRVVVASTLAASSLVVDASLALHALNCALALRRLRCTGALALLEQLFCDRELPGLRRLTAAECAAYEDVCAVCLSALDSSARMTTCGHSFHRQCIVRCLEERPNCPMCQRRILQ